MRCLGIVAALCVVSVHQAQSQTVAQGTAQAAAGHAVEAPCADRRVAIAAGSVGERLLACSAAGDALQLLGQCGIVPQRPVHVRIMPEVRHPRGGAIFGLFDTKHETVLITRPDNIASLVRDTPFSSLPHREFYRSLIVHEVVHGVMHQSYKRRPTSHAAHEYPAYVLQLASLPSGLRDEFLRTAVKGAARSDLLFNDVVLHFDPYYFAARAYEHFTASPDPCAHLHALLKGEVDFIATLP